MLTLILQCSQEGSLPSFGKGCGQLGYSLQMQHIFGHKLHSTHK